MNRPVDKLLDAIGGPDRKSIHFVDLENLVGAGFYTSEQVAKVCESYVSGTASNAKDLFFISSGTQNKEATYTGWSWGNVFFQFRKGQNGADQALVNFFESIQTPEVYQSVYVASGDHSLEAIAEGARKSGLSVTIVTGKGGTSRALRAYPQLQLRGL